MLARVTAKMLVNLYRPISRHSVEHYWDIAFSKSAMLEIALDIHRIQSTGSHALHIVLRQHCVSYFGLAYGITVIGNKVHGNNVNGKSGHRKKVHPKMKKAEKTSTPGLK